MIILGSLREAAGGHPLPSIMEPGRAVREDRPLVQVGAPVGRHPAGRARDRLIGGVAVRRGQLRPGFIELVRRIAPEPGLPRLEAADDRVPGGRRVRARVLRRRGVAAADVPALGTPAQVEPPAAGRLTLHAAGPRGRHAGLDSWLFGHAGSSRSASGAVSGRQTWKRVLPGSDSTRRSPWCLLTTIRQEMSSPRPVPSPTSLVVKNGSKIRSRMSAGTPGPVSPISTSARSPSRAVRTVSVPVPPIAYTALSIRFVQTWFSSAA